MGTDKIRDLFGIESPALQLGNTTKAQQACCSADPGQFATWSWSTGLANHRIVESLWELLAMALGRSRGEVGCSIEQRPAEVAVVSIRRLRAILSLVDFLIVVHKTILVLCVSCQENPEMGPESGLCGGLGSARPKHRLCR